MISFCIVLAGFAVSTAGSAFRTASILQDSGRNYVGIELTTALSDRERADVQTHVWDYTTSRRVSKARISIVFDDRSGGTLVGVYVSSRSPDAAASEPGQAVALEFVREALTSSPTIRTALNAETSSPADLSPRLVDSPDGVAEVKSSASLELWWVVLIVVGGLVVALVLIILLVLALSCCCSRGPAEMRCEPLRDSERLDESPTKGSLVRGGSVQPSAGSPTGALVLTPAVDRDGVSRVLDVDGQPLYTLKPAGNAAYTMQDVYVEDVEGGSHVRPATSPTRPAAGGDALKNSGSDRPSTSVSRSPLVMLGAGSVRADVGAVWPRKLTAGAVGSGGGGGV